MNLEPTQLIHNTHHFSPVSLEVSMGVSHTNEHYFLSFTFHNRLVSTQKLTYRQLPIEKITLCASYRKDCRISMPKNIPKYLIHLLYDIMHIFHLILTCKIRTSILFFFPEEASQGFAGTREYGESHKQPYMWIFVCMTQNIAFIFREVCGPPGSVQGPLSEKFCSPKSLWGNKEF